MFNNQLSRKEERMALVCRDCRAVHVLVLALASFNSLNTESEKVAPVSRRSWPQHTLMAGPEGPKDVWKGWWGWGPLVGIHHHHSPLSTASALPSDSSGYFQGPLNRRLGTWMPCVVQRHMCPLTRAQTNRPHKEAPYVLGKQYSLGTITYPNLEISCTLTVLWTCIRFHCIVSVSCGHLFPPN